MRGPKKVLAAVFMAGLLTPASAACATGQGNGPQPFEQTTLTRPEGMGLAFVLPTGWSITRVNGYTVLLSGPDGSPDWGATLTITNQQNPTPSSTKTGARSMLQDYTRALKTRLGTFEVLREAEISIPGHRMFATGMQTVVRFQGQTGPFRQWTIVLPRSDMAIAHVLIFTAPDELFDRNLPNVRRVLETVLPLERRR